MLVMAVCSSLIGAALGLKFKALVLLPATVIGVAVIIGVTALEGGSPAVVSAIVWTAALQFGYLGGRLIRVA